MQDISEVRIEARQNVVFRWLHISDQIITEISEGEKITLLMPSDKETKVALIVPT